MDIWAPGTLIHTVPNPDSSNPLLNGTSMAAPIVSGIAALLASINPSLKPDDIRNILRDTAHTDSPDPKSNRILNGYRAVLTAIGFALPPGAFEEPNNTAATAKDLVQTSTNVWEPLGETTISQASDVVWHRFKTAEYADISITLDYVRGLSVVTMELLPEPGDGGMMLADATDTRTPGKAGIGVQTGSRQGPT